MALGFATIDIAIQTRINYNFDTGMLLEYNCLIAKHKIKSLYEQYALANVISFLGYSIQRCCDKRVQKAFNSLLNKGIIKIENEGYYLNEY